ncbi:hypothetical protein QBC36DRAFT_156245, partial [Triangularia setosa]
LPWELRNKIRKLAICPDVPGVHVFRVYHSDHPRQLSYSTHHEATQGSCGEEGVFPTKLNKSHAAAPRCLSRGVYFSPAQQKAAPISWTANNPSSYLIDS